MVASGANSTNSSVLACRTRGDTGIDLLQSMFGYSNTFSCKKLAGHRYKSVQKENLALAYRNIEAYEIDYCMASYRTTENLCSVVFSYRIMTGKWCAPSFTAITPSRQAHIRLLFQLLQMFMHYLYSYTLRQTFRSTLVNSRRRVGIFSSRTRAKHQTHEYSI